MRILTVEDDELLAQTVAKILTQQHYAVDIALDGETGWQYAVSTPYDLILLDIVLPKLDGISLCQRLRQEGYQTPILLFTAKDSSTDKVIGLDAGADDYVIKPIDFNELMARIRALLRRGQPASSPLLTWSKLSLDPSSLEVTYDGQPLHLTATEHRLLELFLRNPQRTFSRNAIVAHLWTYDDQPEASTVKTYIKNLRQKLKAVDASADLIETVYGLGYRLKPESSPETTESSIRDPSSPTVEINSKEQQILQAVTQARESFKNQICDRLRVLKQAVEVIELDTSNSELCKQATYEAHRFAGSLGTFGFTTAAQLAETIEDRLQIQPLDSPQVKQIRQLVDELSQALERFLIQPDAIAGGDPIHPQVAVISKDSPWVQSFIQTACNYPLTVKAIAVAAEDEWVAQTLHILQNELPNVVLLDLDAAPTPQVMSLLTEVSRQLPIPVLAITEYDNFDDRIEVARRGGRKFLLKTVSSDRVLEQALQVLQYVQAGDARILVVDSDRSTLEKIRDILQPWGLQLKLLTDPQQFWQNLVSFSPNLLIVSEEMPHFNGTDLCRVVRTDPDWSRLPVVFLTTHSKAEILHQLFAIGADDCISKPITGAKLLTLVLNRLARSLPLV